MPLQTWDVVVHGRSRRIEIDRNPDSGKYLLRVDGRVALKPFAETRGEFRLEIDGKPFLLHVKDGAFDLEDKGSRYHDTTAARPNAKIGRITICRGLEHVSVITDAAILRIEKLSDAMKAAASAGAGGGLLGAILTEAAAHVTQKMVDTFGATTIESPLRTFDDLRSEVVCRLEHLPLDLVTLFADEIDLATRVLVVPRHVIRSLTPEGKKLIVETERTRASGKPHKFDTLHETQHAIEHLEAAGYFDVAQTSHTIPAHQPGVAATPVKSFSGISEVRWTAPLVSTIGRDPELLGLMEEDAAVWTAVYPKTVMRRVRVEDPFRNLGRERYDIVHMLGTFDAKTRFKEIGGFGISLKDLISRLAESRVRMLWLASANDEAAANETLRWASGLNFFVVMTLARGPGYRSTLETALRRLSGGEALSTVLPEIESASGSRFRLTGRGESIFLPRD